jgi:hypothetical protein
MLANFWSEFNRVMKSQVKELVGRLNMLIVKEKLLKLNAICGLNMKVD